MRKLKREDVLADKNQLAERERERDPQSISVCTWHPTLRKLPNILRESFKTIANDPKLNPISPGGGPYGPPAEKC